MTDGIKATLQVEGVCAICHHCKQTNGRHTRLSQHLAAPNIHSQSQPITQLNRFVLVVEMHNVSARRSGQQTRDKYLSTSLI